VKDIMISRIDFATLPPGCRLDGAIAAARRLGHCKLPVLDAANDDFAGWVDVRALYALGLAGAGRAEDTVEAHARDFRYFSELDRADQVLERIKAASGDLFAAVDERGVVVGFFTLQDIMDEVLGHFGEHGAPPPQDIRESAGGYALSGQLSVREWRDLFDVSRDLPKSATVGGLVVSLLGRIPRVGDIVELDNMEMSVLATWHNRVTEVGLRLKGEDRDKTVKKISARMFRS
jgi:CBS domain containing-hemolysin-like protein